MNRKNIKILVIDDEKVLLENIQSILTEEGFDIVTAHNGIEGVKKFISEKPDLIICDIVMPGMDGYEVLKRLSNLYGSPVPFIFLSAKTDSADLRKGMNLGADDYVFKPFETEDLLKSINVRLEKFGIISDKFTDTVANEKQINNEEKVFVNFNNVIQPVPINDIKIIEAQNQYSKLFIKNGNTVVLKKPLSQWESALPESTFIRVHRSFIINISFIKKIDKSENNKYRVFIDGVDNPIEISRRYTTKVLAFIKINS